MKNTLYYYIRHFSDDEKVLLIFLIFWNIEITDGIL